jgi:translation initiation factor 4G
MAGVRLSDSAAEATIVPAREQHAAFLAWVNMTASRSHLERGVWDLYVDGSEEECLRLLTALATTETQHWARWSNFIVAEVDGTPAAALCGYFDEELGTPLLLRGVSEADRTVGRSEEDGAAGWQRAGAIAQVMTGHAPGTWIVECVATRPEFRRRGLVDRLMAEILERGRQRGATVADIGVFIGNDPAQRAYEKAGFTIVAERRHPEFEAAYKCPGVRSMSRPL